MHVIGHIERGPAWRPGLPVTAQGEPMVRHLHYMKGLYDHGRLMLGGPYETGAAGGIAVFVTGSLEDAERLAADDPAARAGVISYRLSTLSAVFDRASDLDRSQSVASMMAAPSASPAVGRAQP